MNDYKQKFDLLIRNYFKNESCFSDFLNGTYFHGQQIALTPDIKLYDGEYSGQLLNRKYIKRSRDNVMMICIDDCDCLVGFEHQLSYDESMFQRVMEYDYLSYKKQYENYRESKCKKKIVGTMTLVLYYGERKWKYPSNYKDMMQEIPYRMKHYVNVNFYPVIQVDKLDESLFQNQRNKQLILGLKYIHSELDEQKSLYVDYDILEILSTLVKDEKILKNIQVNEEGKIDMCKYIEKMKKQEREKGQLQDRCETLINQLKVKFHNLSKETETLIYESDMNSLNKLTIQIFQVNNEDDVRAILSQKKKVLS